MASQNNQNTTWLYVVEAIALVLFGIAAIAWPGLTLYSFVILFGIYALVAGVANVVGGILNIGRGWSAIGSLILGGLLIAAGSYVFNHPTLLTTLVLLVAFTLIVRGIFEIVTAVSSDLPSKTLTVVSGIIGLIIGLVLLRYPIGGGLAYVWVLGIYALVSGPIMLAVGLNKEK